MRAEEDKRGGGRGERRKLVRRFSVGQIVRGKITNITPFGALLALGDIYGLLHISEMTSSALESPMKRFTIGQKLRVRVVHIDRVNGKLGLSLKRLLPSNGKTTKPSNGKTTSAVINRPASVELSEEPKENGPCSHQSISDQPHPAIRKGGFCGVFNYVGKNLCQFVFSGKNDELTPDF